MQREERTSDLFLERNPSCRSNRTERFSSAARPEQARESATKAPVKGAGRESRPEGAIADPRPALSSSSWSSVAALRFANNAHKSLSKP